MEHDMEPGRSLRNYIDDMTVTFMMEGDGRRVSSSFLDVLEESYRKYMDVDVRFLTENGFTCTHSSCTRTEHVDVFRKNVRGGRIVVKASLVTVHGRPLFDSFMEVDGVVETVPCMTVHGEKAKESAEESVSFLSNNVMIAWKKLNGIVERMEF